MARRRFFVDEVRRDRAVIRGPQAFHLARVLRAKPGEVCELSDGQRLFLGRIEVARPSVVEFAIEEELEALGAGAPVTLLAAIFKFDRMEWMLEKAVELGVARIVPVVAARTSKALAQAATARVRRWRRLALEAAQQSRRLAPPEITAPLAFENALGEAGVGRRVLLDENEAAADATLAPAATLLVGPEGGWTDQERRLALDNWFEPVSLGPLILRAETAAIVALGALMLSADQ